MTVQVQICRQETSDTCEHIYTLSIPAQLFTMQSPSTDSKYNGYMPSIRKEPLQMYKPKRKGEEKMALGDRDVIKSLHVGEYYEFVATTWNNSDCNKESNKFEAFDDGLDARDRTKMHKKRIGEILTECLGDLYSRYTLSQARKLNYNKVKSALEIICEENMFRIYKQHSFNGWLIEKLVEQKMESASRLRRSKKIGYPSGSATSKEKRSSRSCDNNGSNTCPTNYSLEREIGPHSSRNNEPCQSTFTPENEILQGERDNQQSTFHHAGNRNDILNSDSEPELSESQLSDEIQQIVQPMPGVSVNEKNKDEQIRALEEQIAMLRQKDAYLNLKDNTDIPKSTRRKRVRTNDDFQGVPSRSKLVRRNANQKIIISRSSREGK